MGTKRSILSHLDPVTVSERARTESRNREVHLPPISTYRWWARRTGAVTSALLEAATTALGRPTLTVGDPFAGGGVIPLIALSQGHTVLASDINPWAAHGLKATLTLPPPERIEQAADRLARRAAPLVATAYGSGTATIAHTLRVAIAPCTACGTTARLFPFATVSLLQRRDRGGTDAWLACPRGHLFRGSTAKQHVCPTCKAHTDPAAAYLPRRTITCPCGHKERLSQRGPLAWEVVLVERIIGRSRDLALPTEAERRQASDARWQPKSDLGTIPPGQESSVLLRHGMRRWCDLYPARQRAVTESLLAMLEDEPPMIRSALRMAVLGTTEMAGHLSRWDRYYLKGYESMASHRFNLTTLTVEPNVWGTAAAGRGTVIRRLRSLKKAARWLHESAPQRLVTVQRCDARAVDWAPGSVDLILTDPPYHDDVGYDELSRPLRAWAGLSMSLLSGQATGGPNYTATLTTIFAHLRGTLRPDGHLVFSFANRRPDVWVSLLGALQAAGFHAAGCAIVHSENELDGVKRSRRSCTLDLILDLVLTPAQPSALTSHIQSPEADFLLAVGETMLRVGQLEEGWEAALITRLSAMEFLRSERKKVRIK